MKWRDRREVSILSTVHNAEMFRSHKRGKRIRKPVAIEDYNGTMGSVGKVDRHLTDYHVTGKRRNIYCKKISFHLMEFAFWNTFVIYKKINIGV